MKHRCNYPGRENRKRFPIIIIETINMMVFFALFVGYLFSQPAIAQISESTETSAAGTEINGDPIYAGFRLSGLNSRSSFIKNSLYRDVDYFWDETDGGGFSAGVYYQHYLGKQNDNRHSIMFIIDYTSLSFKMVFPYISESFQIDAFGNKSFPPVYAESGMTNELDYFTLQALYTYTLPVPLAFSAGLGITGIIRNYISEKVTILNAEGENNKFTDSFKPIRYENNRNTAVLAEGSPAACRDILLSIIGEAKYEIRTGLGFDIIPYAGLNVFLSSFSENVSWGQYSFYYGIALRLGLTI